jgi:hypothetical protein
MEHRWGNRHEVSQSVRVATRSGVLSLGLITNVSMSGAFVVSPLAAGLFSYVKIQFNSAWNGRPTMLEGQVVRKEATGFAIEWRELAPAVVEALVGRPRLPSRPEGSQGRSPRLVFQRPVTPAVSTLSVE